jgi:alpha-L-fucosidase
MENNNPLYGSDSQWFTNARFGLFIHWGIAALPARQEWMRHYEEISNEDYQKYYDHFDPDLFDPRIWAAEARNAGMKYLVVVSKHHDGFCLWDSALTDYKANCTPYKKDLLQPILKAFGDEGLRPGLYYSMIDWHHPEFTVDGLHPQRNNREFREAQAGRDWNKYLDYMYGQIRELLTQFGKIDILWLDFSYSEMIWDWCKGKGKDDWQSEKLLEMVRNLQPGIMVNDRLEIGGDFVTPEEYQPREGMQKDGKPIIWETCQTMNGNGAWGYTRDNLTWKSTEMLVKTLIDAVSKGGNFLLNVGSNARGELPPQAVERLRGIGEWMRLHARSIYGCGKSEFTPPEDCRYTQNGKRLYLHVYSWPLKFLHLDDLENRVEYAQLLNDGSEIKMKVIDPKQPAHNIEIGEGKPGSLTLELPIKPPDVTVPVIELFLK